MPQRGRGHARHPRFRIEPIAFFGDDLRAKSVLGDAACASELDRFHRIGQVLGLRLLCLFGRFEAWLARFGSLRFWRLDRLRNRLERILLFLLRRYGWLSLLALLSRGRRLLS